MLGTIYYIYVGPRQKIGFGLNFNRPQFGIPNILPAAARRSFLFARFDNTSTDGGAVDLAACAIASEGSVASSLYDMEDTFENTEYSPNLQEAGERAVATFSELQKREQEEQADLLNLNDIEE
ncbi:uncharacterized protein LOC113366121 [Ctenocephalides felis]|nr:uncharacterized protein LOC113366121 [Ctenocephalides felis]